MSVKSDKNAAWLTDLLQEGEVYEVGGSVRDRLLGAGTPPVSKDQDYLVRLIPLPALQRRL
ncbi:MAG TPA: hypothetical protein VM118_14150, partial [Acidobacteriota bacterium]|nr:hypothetical protein [Acidobacteriota bacterium]